MSDTSRRVFDFEEIPSLGRVGTFGLLNSIVGIRVFVTGRESYIGMAGFEGSAEAAETLAAKLNLDGISYAHQVHGDDVLAVNGPGLAGEADGLVTARKGLALMGASADCPLILAADRSGRAVGMAHASWRGTVKSIAAGLIDSLAENFSISPDELVACVCPSAGPCCYEVGPDVVAAAVAGIGPGAQKFFIERGGRVFFDLWSANVDQLIQAGLVAENVCVAGICTICRSDLYPSYRVEAESAGRFYAVISLR